MLTFRTNSTLFTHVIAASTHDEAIGVAVINIRHISGSVSRVEQWHTPDVWTRRAVDMALTPCIIDTIPRFVVDRKSGPVYLDIDDVPAKLSPTDRAKIGDDSHEHCAWLLGCMLERERGEDLRKHIAELAMKQHPLLYAVNVRALAGAWGLGPIPEWHAAILPALIALDIETTDCVNAFGDDVFDMDQSKLCSELYRCALITESVPAWCAISMLTLGAGLSSNADVFGLRARTNSVLAMAGWLP